MWGCYLATCTSPSTLLSRAGKTGNKVLIQENHSDREPETETSWPCALVCILPCLAAWLGPASESLLQSFGFLGLTLNSGSTECVPVASASPFLLSPSPWAWAHTASMLGHIRWGAAGWGALTASDTGRAGSSVSEWQEVRFTGISFCPPPQSLPPPPLRATISAHPKRNWRYNRVADPLLSGRPP